MCICTITIFIKLSPKKVEVEMIVNTKDSINSATIKDLESIDGIGQITAKRIYDYIQKHDVKTFSELDDIQGIGEKKIEKIKNKK